MMIEISAPDEWTPGRAVAVRTLPRRAIRGGLPLIAAVRADVTPDALSDSYGRAGALLREAGMAA
jgi:hypothetical protein